MKPFESQVQQLYEGSACALSQLYGGMPEVGGFRPFTEYEVGAGRIAEAAHCILGSCGKVWGAYLKTPDYVDATWRTERGHFNEEIGIIMKVLNEYSRDLYSGRNFLENPYAEQSIQDMQTVAPKLKERAKKYRRLLDRDRKQYDPKLYEIAWWAYAVIIRLADVIYESVDGAVNQPNFNAFASRDFQLQCRVLKSKIEDAYA